MKRNTELLQQTMQHIKDHPEKHDQNDWYVSCGTTACFAGWTVLLSGVIPTEMENLKWTGFGTNPRTGALDWRYNAIAKEARRLLGLTMTESVTVFKSANSVPMLELMVKDLCNGDKLRSTTAYTKEAADE